MTVIILTCLGVVGGAYLIPFDSFIQVNSPDEHRGQIIAAANFFSFVGVLMAAFFLYFVSEDLGLSAKTGFLAMGLLTFFFNSIMIGRLSSLFFPFFIKKILKRFRKLIISTPIPSSKTVTMLQSNSWWDAILLFSCLDKLHILVPTSFFCRFPWINGWFDTIQIVSDKIDTQENLEKVLMTVQNLQKKEHTVCLLIRRREDGKQLAEAYSRYFRSMKLNVSFAHGTKERILRSALFFRWYQRRITLRFSEE